MRWMSEDKTLFYLTCQTTFVFNNYQSVVHYHHPALLHRQALIPDRLMTFLMAFSILAYLKSILIFKIYPPIRIYPLLRLICWNLTTQCLTVTGGGSVGTCKRLSQPSWLLGTLYYSYTYLLTYLSFSSSPISPSFTPLVHSSQAKKFICSPNLSCHRPFI